MGFIPLKKIDIHVHMLPRVGIPGGPEGFTYVTPEQVIGIYDEIGVERGVVLPEIGLEASMDLTNNREIEDIVKKYPDRFSWFCNIDPRQGKNSPDTDFSYFLDYYKGIGARGVGELCCNLYFDDPLVLNLFRHCEKKQMPVIFHIGKKGNDYGLVDELGLPRLEKALQMFPDLQFLGHSQKFWAEISGDTDEKNRFGYPEGPVIPGGRIVELMRKYPNLCGDLSARSGYNALARDESFAAEFLEEFSDRLYYGTDICSYENRTDPMLRLASLLDRLAETGKISYETYEKVSRGNAERLLGL